MAATKSPVLVYPPNLHELDLASMVSLYRSRGEPRRAAPGKFLGCSLTGELIREGKWWFGLYYSQSAWDRLLTKNSGGYPMTHTEFLAMGKIKIAAEPCYREFLEAQVGVSPKLAYLIINDLKQFGFIQEDIHGVLFLSPDGEKALDGISRRLFGKRFVPEFINEVDADHDVIPGSRAAQGSPVNQVSLF